MSADEERRSEKLADAMRLLVGERDELFQDERALRLYQFQAWIFQPGRLLPLRAGTLLAAKILEEQEKQQVLKRSSKSASFLTKMLRDEAYSEIYNEFIGRRGGWTVLLREGTLHEFDLFIWEQQNPALTVAEMIDFRFRATQHRKNETELANITHGQYFVYRNKLKPVSGKIVRKRWSIYKDSAAFLYVSMFFDFNFYPRRLGQKNALEQIRLEAEDVDNISEFVAKTRFVYEQLSTITQPALPIEFPDSVTAISPTTAPLSDEELARMADYKDGVHEMRDG